MIPLMFRAVETGEPVALFGNDYPTPDGTCIRDYVHVTDLAQAHILAVEALMTGAPSNQFNVVTGSGRSVLEIIRAMERVTGKAVPYVISPRRERRPARLVADSNKLRRTLGLTPKLAEIEQIVATAREYRRRRPSLHFIRRQEAAHPGGAA